MSPAAIQYALADAKADILTMAKLLCEAGYPRRGTPEESQSIYDFAAKVQTLIPHADAVELGRQSVYQWDASGCHRDSGSYG